MPAFEVSNLREEEGEGLQKKFTDKKKISIIK
jgi:hypothetical protein